jgi:hypothetical protein
MTREEVPLAAWSPHSREASGPVLVVGVCAACGCWALVWAGHGPDECVPCRRVRMSRN